MPSSCGSSCGEEMFKYGLTEEKCGRQGMDNDVTNSFGGVKVAILGGKWRVQPLH